jgi:hypothetical protein
MQKGVDIDRKQLLCDMLYRVKNKMEVNQILLDDHLAEIEKGNKNNITLLETFVLSGQILASEQLLCNKLDQTQVNCYMTLSFR